ncbi:hypothetical protein [Micromonospora sp. NPDC049891]|uniref:hypothetical protein n=1 Tax=Micromonospora sp. NPDC049891 TaxID=3155655 RepID=UPI0033EC9742
MGEPTREMPAASECRRLASDCAAADNVARSVMWSLLAIAGDLAELRRDLRRAR